jgi:hypothetical protein
MRVRTFVFVSALTLVTAGIASVAALHASPVVQQGQTVEPKPMAADHPLAKRAAVVAEQILAGNRDAVIAAMKTDGTPELAANPNLEAMVDRYITQLAKKGYKISEFNTGIGSDVIVRLTGGPEETNVVIRFSAAEPHKLQGLAQARPGG